MHIHVDAKTNDDAKGINKNRMKDISADDTNDAKITLKKTPDSDNVLVVENDTIPYEITIKNISDIDITKIELKDTLPVGLSINPGTLKIGNDPSSEDIQSGITITNTLSKDEFITVRFEANVDTVFKTSPYEFLNTATAKYYFELTPGEEISEEIISNEVIATAKVMLLDVAQETNKSQFNLGDIIEYSINIRNIGTALIKGAVLHNIFDSNFKVDLSTVKINGEMPEVITDMSNLQLTDIPAEESSEMGTVDTNPTVVTFSGRVIGIPLDGNIVNEATVSYEDTTITPSTQVSAEAVPKMLKIPTSESPIMSIYVTHEVDKSLANPGDRLRYTISITNSGNMPVRGTRLNNLVDPNINVDLSSIRINGLALKQGAYLGVDNLALPEIPVQLSGVHPTEIIFEGTIIGNPNKVTNEAKVTYTDVIEPGNPDRQIELRQSTLVVPATGPSFTVVQEARVNDIGTYSTTTEAEVGDVVNYRINIPNTGNIELNSGTLSDTPPAGLVSTPSSIRTNSTTPTTIPRDLSNLALSSLPVEIISQPSTTDLTYNTTTGIISKISNTAIINLIEPNANFTVTKEATVNGLGVPSDNISAIVGDTINFILSVTNTGNVTLTDGSFNKFLSDGLKLDENSVTVNEESIVVAGDGLTNIPLGELPIGTTLNPSTTIIKFNVVITSKKNSISDIDTISYKGVETSLALLTKDSNAVIVNVQPTADYSVVKEFKINKQGDYASDKMANEDDIVNCRITITNTCGIAFTGGTLNDILDSNLTIVSNSITVNGLPRTATGNDLVNIALPSLPVGGPQNPGTTVILFDATITGLGPIISNTASISYNPAGPQPPINKTPSPAIITVNHPSKNPDFIAVKEVRTNESGNYVASTTANQGDTVNYRITITNTGNVAFNNGGTLTEILNDNLAVEANSVFVGNTIVPVIGNNLNNMTLPPLNIGSSITVKFSAKVLSNGIGILNEATPITYNYTGQISPTTKSSTIAKVNADLLGMTKTVCSKSASLGTILTYTVVLTNNSLQPLNNIVLNDLLDSNLTLIPGSIYVNGVLKPIEITLNNLSLPSLPVTTPKSSNTVTFSAKVTGVGTVATNQTTATYLVGAEHETRTAASNVVTTTISAPYISVAKSVNLCRAMIKDTLRYTIIIANRGNVKITNIILADKLDERLEVVPGSVRINGAPPLQEKVDIHKLSLPDLLAPTGVQTMTTLTITFDAVIKDIKRYLNSSSMYCQETSKPFTVCNHAMIAYGFDGEVIGVLKTNRVSTDIIIPSPCLTAVKSVSSECARVGDILTYTIILNNTGNMPLTGIVLSDIVPTNLIVNPSTIKINGVPVPGAAANTLMNLKIPNMPVPPAGSLEPIVVAFDVTVGSISSNSVFNRRPCIQNMATVTYRRVGSRFSMTTNTNTVSTRITNNSSKYDAFVPINLSPCDPLVDTVLQVTPTVRSISPSSQKYNIVINVLYSIVLSYRSADGKMKEITKHYKVEIPNPGYTVSTKVTVNSVGNPIIIKGHQVNVKLRFNITN
ncbi:hypothetical protein [Clostridium sp. UBA1056]|uniref:hypothetical protein n=1 Tax=unclassified Clostridium TaxID=2614128 RepID=UPI0032165E1A